MGVSSVVSSFEVARLLASVAPVSAILASLALPVSAGADGAQDAAGDAVFALACLAHLPLVFGGDGAAVEGVSLLALLHGFRAFA